MAELEKKAEPFKPEGFEFADYRENMRLQTTFREYVRLAQREGNAEKLAELAAKLWRSRRRTP